MSTSEGKISSAKGKAADDGRRWRANWWDMHPLVEDVRRPIAWSSSCTIFTAHPTQPIIIARLFPSSEQFLVVSPDPILRSPASYGPPTVISVSPNDSWLFAFFPSHEADGLACLWNRGSCVNVWAVKEYWAFSRGAGVVTCAWAGAEREWATFADGSSFRLPSRGPLTPVSNPTLLLVTQAHELHVCYIRTYVSSLKMLSCPLNQPSYAAEGQPLSSLHDVPTGPRTSRLCIRAAVGFIYGESSILVATRSRRYPTAASFKSATHDDLDFGIPLDIPQPQDRSSEEYISSLEWGALAEEQTIELCEVKLRFDGMFTSLISQPLPPLHHPFPHMNDLAFVCSPPPKLDPSASPRISPKRDKQPVRSMEPPITFLVASFLDFEEYNTNPKSAVVAFTLARASSPISIKPGWAIHQVGERSISPRILTLFCPIWISINPSKRGLIALMADSDGHISRRGPKAREVVVGSIAVLRLPELTEDIDWEQSPITTPTNRAGMDWPINVATSRNQMLACATALSRVSTYTLPKRLVNISALNDATSRGISSLSVALVTALQSRRSIADIAHILAMSAVSSDTIVDTLRGTWLAFEMNVRAGVSGAFSVADVLGATVELYRTRARLLADDEDPLSGFWRNAHDMCSVMACLAAFEDCKEPEGYDLEATWQLVSLSGWVVSFLERLMRECLSAIDLTHSTPNTTEVQPKLEPVDDTNIFTIDESKQPPISPLDSPILLHLAHPLIISNLFAVTIHVNRFYHSLSVLTPKGENSQIARDILMDTIGCSGLDLKAIEEILKSTMSDTRNTPGDEARLSLSKCHPVPAQYPFLRKVVHTLFTSTAVDKSRLFLKSTDLVDGFASLITYEQSEKGQARDVVTKGVLPRRNSSLLCLRCGHQSEVGGEVNVAGYISLRWKTWEKMWASRCICGGGWITRKV